MKHREIIDRMRAVIGAESLAALARELEIAPSAINAAIRQKRLPDVWIYKVAYRTGRRVEWLRSGEGPEFADKASEEEAKYGPLSPALKALLEQRAGLNETQQSIVDRAQEMLLSSDAETRALMLQVLDRVYEHHKLTLQKRRSAPQKKSAGSA